MTKQEYADLLLHLAEKAHPEAIKATTATLKYFLHGQEYAFRKAARCIDRIDEPYDLCPRLARAA